MTLIDNAIYVDGRRVATPRNLDETYTLQETHRRAAPVRGARLPDHDPARGVARHGFGAASPRADEGDPPHARMVRALTW